MQHPLSSTTGHVKIAFHFVRERGIPIHHGIRDRFHQALRDDRPLTELRELQRRDLGVLVECLDTLTRMGVEDAFEKVSSPDGLSLLREALERNLFRVPALEHRLGGASEAQLLPLRRSIISGAVASALLAGDSAEEPLVSSAAMVRSLGLAYASWNYPALFARALAAEREGQRLEDHLSRKLGFSVGMLGLLAAHGWGASDETLGIIGWRETTLTPDAERLRLICALGDELAKMSEPHREPVTSTNLESFEKKLIDLAGSHAMERVIRCCTDRLQAYAATLNDFAPLPAWIAEREGSRVDQVTPTFPNTLPDDLRRLAGEVIESMEARHELAAAIDLLFSRLTPALGIEGCGLYLLDPDSGHLVRRFVRAADLPPQVRLESASLIARAARRGGVVVEQMQDADGRSVMTGGTLFTPHVPMGVLVVTFSNQTLPAKPAALVETLSIVFERTVGVLLSRRS